VLMDEKESKKRKRDQETEEGSKWKAVSQDSLRLFLGFFASEQHALKAVKDYAKVYGSA
jgi:hypothetical protein